MCNTSILDKLPQRLPFPAFSSANHRKQRPLGPSVGQEHIAQGLINHTLTSSTDGGPAASLINMFQYCTTDFSQASPRKTAIYS